MGEIHLGRRAPTYRDGQMDLRTHWQLLCTWLWFHVHGCGSMYTLHSKVGSIGLYSLDTLQRLHTTVAAVSEQLVVCVCINWITV